MTKSELDYLAQNKEPLQHCFRQGLKLQSLRVRCLATVRYASASSHLNQIIRSLAELCKNRLQAEELTQPLNLGALNHGCI